MLARSRRGHWLAVFVVALVAGIAASALTADASAGPRYIIVHGGGLPVNALLDDQRGNDALLEALEVAARSAVERRDQRPAFELALFYRVPDLGGRTPRDLRPEEAGAQGRFYPAYEGLPAELELAAVPGLGPRRSGVVTAAALDYLVLKGVPVTLDQPLAPIQAPTPIPESAFEPVAAPDGRSGFGILAGVAGGVVVLGFGLAVWAWLRSRRRPVYRRLR